MDFERARTKEQKNVRVMEIIEAAIKQYNEIPYDKITLASISSELSFTRVNLYKYFKTKEEIFLKIIELDTYSLLDRLNLIFKGQPSKNIITFANKWAAAFFSQGRMLELNSRLFCEIKKHVSPEKLAEFETCYHNMQNDLCAIAAEQMPYLSKNNVHSFINAHNIFAIGLYPMCKATESRAKAMKIAGLKNDTPDFKQQLSNFIVTYVKGIQG